MKYILIILASFLAACSSKGMLNEPPRATSAASAVDVRIHNAIAGGHVTFTIDHKEIYGFVEPGHFDFVLDAGGYKFGYKKGDKKCYADVMLNAGNEYEFELKPDCIIEMQ